MNASRQIIAALIAGGMDPADAAFLVACSAAELSPPADTRSSGAKRQAAWRERNKPSQTVSTRQDDEASQTVTKRLETSQSNASQNPPISTSKNLKTRERQNRGTRISAGWALTDAERSFAKQEGFSDWEIQREAQKFRDYWTAAAGSKAVKLDWLATWRQWIRSGAERAGKTPAPSAGAAAATTGYYAKPDSEQLEAWDTYNRTQTGKTLARDRNGGWHVKSEWPPGHIAAAPSEQPAQREAVG